MGLQVLRWLWTVFQLPSGTWIHLHCLDVYRELNISCRSTKTFWASLKIETFHQKERTLDMKGCMEPSNPNPQNATSAYKKGVPWDSSKGLLPRNNPCLLRVELRKTSIILPIFPLYFPPAILVLFVKLQSVNRDFCFFWSIPSLGSPIWRGGGGRKGRVWI